VNSVSAKVSLVQRKDIPNMPFFSQTNERGIGQVHGIITIFLHQDSHPLVVVRSLKSDFEIPLMKHAPKRFLCAPTAGFSEKIHRLRESRPSRHHRSLQVGQTRHARLVIRLSRKSDTDRPDRLTILKDTENLAEASADHVGHYLDNPNFVHDHREIEPPLEH
jgi:hypothetical protein